MVRESCVTLISSTNRRVEEDNRFHLAGATRILNSISSFVSSDGLSEAVAWLCLRQDIYISIISKQPLKTNLDQFHTSSSIQRENDMCWANKMVLLLASILSHAFAEASTFKQATLQQLTNDLEKWHSDKPLSFDPIKNIPRGKTRGNRLPTIWMLSPFHVLGVQYYHIAKIVLLFASPLTKDGLVGGVEDFQRSRRIERTIREHLLTILGLAISNPRAENTLFTARHTLAAWGGVLHNKLDQEAATGFLMFMERTSGWKMTKTLDALNIMWHEDKDSD
jgi:hypothetical protein